MTVDTKVNTAVILFAVMSIVNGIAEAKLGLSRRASSLLGLATALIWSVLLIVWAVNGPWWLALLLCGMTIVAQAAMRRATQTALNRLRRKG